MNLIFASDVNNLIGDQGSLPWIQRSDLARFRSLTTKLGPNGEYPVVIMGGKTQESLNGKRLTGRYNIVISRKPFIHNDGADRRFTKEEFLEWLPGVSETVPMWVIGGEQIFSMLVDHVKTIYHTRVKTSHISLFPSQAVHWSIPLFDFRCVEQSELYPADEINQFDYQFTRYERYSK